jgi:minor extracellular serine protease Vpr
MKRLSGALAVICAFALTIAASGAIAGGGTVSDLGSTAPTVDTSSAIVQLNGDPLSTYAKTKPAPGKKIDFSSNTTKSYRAQLSALRNDFKQWLRANAPSAKVTGEFDISLNAVAVQLNGASLGTIASAPMVKKAQYEGLYHPLDNNDPDLALIHAIDAWAAVGGPANAGKGVKVGIIDTGIDQTHPCFNPAGYLYPAGFPKGVSSLTTAKVIVAKVFNNQSNRFHYTPEAIQEHGTHVAGTVACNLDTHATVAGVSIPYGVSGVAPKAWLGNYNVFPGNDDNARSEDILNALDAAYEDGMDVINMSLGGNAHGVQDLLTDAVDDLDEAGMVSAVAAGNSGPGHFTVESPGSAARALTAGAFTVGHFVGAPVTVGGSTYPAASGDFATVASDLTAPLGAVLSGTSLATACSALPAGSLTGKIALISRGTCTFSAKIRNAQTAGAVAALIVNNVAGDPTAMGQDGTANQPTIPAYMVGLANRAALVAANGSPTTIGATMQYFLTGNSNIMAGFSSQGPTDVDFRVKPDVVSPGVNVLSSIPGNKWAFFQGTSMATPHLAGSAAVLIGAHPDWSAAEVRSAIVNTADQGVVKNFQTGTVVVTDANIVGAGRDNVLSALNARVALDPVSLSFGAVPSGSGQTKVGTIALTTLAGAPATAVTISSSTGTGVSYTATLSGNAISVGMSAAKGASAGDHQATLRVFSGGTEIAHAVVYTLVK